MHTFFSTHSESEEKVIWHPTSRSDRLFSIHPSSDRAIHPRYLLQLDCCLRCTLIRSLHPGICRLPWWFGSNAVMSYYAMVRSAAIRSYEGWNTLSAHPSLTPTRTEPTSKSFSIEYIYKRCGHWHPEWVKIFMHFVPETTGVHKMVVRDRWKEGGEVLNICRTRYSR